jgi:hypothetical protein
VGQGLPVHIRTHVRVPQKCLDLRPEYITVLRFDEIERLLADSVPREEKAPTICVPDRESKHAVESLKAALSIDVVRGEDDLGVATRSKVAPLLLELSADPSMVVKFPVVSKHDISTSALHRLLPSCEVDDLQPASREPDVSFPRYPNAVLVGSAMDDGIAHVTKELARDVACRINGGDESTHQRLLGGSDR